MSKRPSSLIDFVSTTSPRYLLRVVILARLFKTYLTGSQKSFLEIGPGRGDVAACLAQHPAMSSGAVLDLSDTAVTAVRARLSQDIPVSVNRGDFRSLTDQQFDFVFSFEVLEHIEDDRQFIQSLGQRCKPGGLWFISVPAYQRKWQLQDLFSGHLRRYEVQELHDKLAAGGFDIVEMIDYGFPLTSLMRPFRDRYYGKALQRNTHKDMEQMTLESGTENKMLVNHNPWPLLIALAPFILLQRYFGWLQRGDGLIVVARRHG